MDLKLFNTKTRSHEIFVPISGSKVTMYNCGPTVYNYAHIGNLRAYIFADVLRRTLEVAGYEVRQVINITDVGHLVGDGDEGEDKMTAALKREGKPLTKEAMREVGDFYTALFREDLEALHIKKPHEMPRASDHIKEDIELVAILLEKNSAYSTRDGIYFDTKTFPSYAEFAKLDLEGMHAGMRVDMGGKRNSSDFALWKFNDELGYDAPFGKGFPGWHVECSAMIKKHLGHPIDIHTGGVDHIPVHHSNEIAQSETAYGAPFVNYWLHSAHMTVDGEKMSKSAGNTYTLNELSERGITPLAFRYWILTAGYSTQINFTWESITAAQSAFNKLRDIVGQMSTNVGQVSKEYLSTFTEMMSSNLSSAEGIALVWKLIKDNSISEGDKYATLLSFDRILGLGFAELQPEEQDFIVPENISELLRQRTVAREKRDFSESDRLRDEIAKLGYEVTDTPLGQKLAQVK